LVGVIRKLRANAADIEQDAERASEQLDEDSAGARRELHTDRIICLEFNHGAR
jgi:transcriptional antiterminator Rof (Rho-off)